MSQKDVDSCISKGIPLQVLEKKEVKVPKVLQAKEKKE